MASMCERLYKIIIKTKTFCVFLLLVVTISYLYLFSNKLPHKTYLIFSTYLKTWNQGGMKTRRHEIKADFCFRPKRGMKLRRSRPIRLNFTSPWFLVAKFPTGFHSTINNPSGDISSWLTLALRLPEKGSDYLESFKVLRTRNIRKI